MRYLKSRSTLQWSIGSSDDDGPALAKGRIVAKLGLDVLRSRCPLLGALAPGPLGEARHVLLVRRAGDTEDALALIEVRGAGEERVALEHLGDDAADAPQIDREAVAGVAEEELGRTVPASDDAVGVGPIPIRRTDVARETKVGDLELTGVVDKQVGGLLVAVEDVVLAASA